MSTPSKRGPKKAKKQEPFVPITMWAVLKAHDWSSLSVMGVSLQCPPEGPHKYLPVFNTREQAIASENGSADNVVQIQTISPPIGLVAKKGKL